MAYKRERKAKALMLGLKVSENFKHKLRTPRRLGRCWISPLGKETEERRG